MRADGIFIALEVHDSMVGDHQLARALAESCPVDIFALRADETLEIVQRNLDECVLCRICLETSPEGAVKVVKLYDDGAILA